MKYGSILVGVHCKEVLVLLIFNLKAEAAHEKRKTALDALAVTVVG